MTPLLGEGKLKDSEEKYRILFENAVDPIVILDKKGKFIEINKKVEEILGYKKKDLIGKRFTETSILTKKSKLIAYKNFIKRMVGFDIKPYDVEVVKKNGEIIIGEINAAPLKEGRKILGDMVIIRDITERKKAGEKLKMLNLELEKKFEELKTLDKMKADFMNVAAHELRTPLIPVVGYVDMLIKGDLGKINEKQKNVLEIIMKNSKRMQKLVQDVLDVTKLESKVMKFDMKKLQIKKIIKNSVDLMKLCAKKKNLGMILKMPDKLPFVIGDEIRLTQVMTNLLDNAIKFTKKGNITVEVGIDGNNILVKVKDTGIGIGKEFLPKVFKKFEQENGVKHEYGGTGLGLTICKEILEAHGGKTWVESRKKMGTTFYFTLPIKK